MITATDIDCPPAVLPAQALAAMLARVVRDAHRVVAPGDEVSITLIERGQARSAGFSGSLAAALDEYQHRNYSGPCLDAAVSGSIVTIPDTAQDRTYPECAAQAARVGIRHIVAVPIMATIGDIVGALNLYGRHHTFEPIAQDTAITLASYAAVALADQAVQTREFDTADRLYEAMNDRALIEQAKGVIMAGRHCTPDEAFALLRQASSRTHRRLRDIAQDLVNATNKGRR